MQTKVSLKVVDFSDAPEHKAIAIKVKKIEKPETMKNIRVSKYMVPRVLAEQKELPAEHKESQMTVRPS